MVVLISLKLGTLLRVTPFSTIIEASKIGRAAFFEPLILILPFNGKPPSMINFFILSLSLIDFLSPTQSTHFAQQKNIEPLKK
jgi:hypothetical protein